MVIMAMTLWSMRKPICRVTPALLESMHVKPQQSLMAEQKRYGMKADE
jgi:hypothetical protein